MDICAVIAEYNPFHHGHGYQLCQARERTGCQYVLVIMSGNFTQRGVPALVDKWERTRMALMGGADMVLELPTGYAVQTAEWFAKGAVSILTGLHTVTHLCFGAESEDLALLSRLAELLAHEPRALSLGIRRYLSQGLSHPAARAAAVSDYLRESEGEQAALTAVSALRTPNNILAIQYLQALSALSSPIRPLAVRRIGAGYHDPALKGTLSSATSIRNAIFHGEAWRTAVPESTAEVLDGCFGRSHGPVDWPKLEEMLFYRLRTMDAAALHGLPDMAEGLHNRIAAAAAAGGGWEDYMKRCKVKRYAASRLGRAAVHALLGMTAGDAALFRSDFPGYARILGFRSQARPLLAHISRNARIPVVTRPSRFRPLTPAQERLWALDQQATDLYSLALGNEKDRRSGRDYTQPILYL